MKQSPPSPPGMRATLPTDETKRVTLTRFAVLHDGKIWRKK
jgi:hypothetical protein